MAMTASETKAFESEVIHRLFLAAKNEDIAALQEMTGIDENTPIKLSITGELYIPIRVVVDGYVVIEAELYVNAYNKIYRANLFGLHSTLCCEYRDRTWRDRPSWLLFLVERLNHKLSSPLQPAATFDWL